MSFLITARLLISEANDGANLLKYNQFCWFVYKKAAFSVEIVRLLRSKDFKVLQNANASTVLRDARF